MAAFANLARRSGLSQLSVRLLNPIVRPDLNVGRPAGPLELAEYAAALTNIGARLEALEILESLDAEKNEDVSLFIAFNHISIWDYARAIPFLESYIEQQTDPYKKLVGQVNLAAALVNESQNAAAEELLRDLEMRTRGKSALRLHANVLELRGQLMIDLKRFSDARRDLDRSETLLREAKSLDDFFVLKWKTFLAAEENTTAENLAALESLKAEAAAKKHWETVRDCDYQRAKFTRDLTLFNKLFHGTPHESFRRRILRYLGGSHIIPEEFDWKPFAEQAGSIVLDVGLGQVGGRRVLKIGQVLQKLTAALTADFYRPARTAMIFARLFPGEHYDPVTSPNRVHKNVSRLRDWIRGQGLPLEIRQSPTGFRLHAIAPVVLRSRLHKKASRIDHVLAKVFKAFGENE
ncbi:MAG TPA: hypothetical protein VFV50_03620, partial [Bdellovibrionales bacterium]|nr:hypothetical protein [Bdellovibrionales bacterium]